MAKGDLVRLLRRGATGVDWPAVADWNDWRAQDPERVVNLSGDDLRGLDLRKVNLRGADLRGANLSGTNLRGADLSEANLSKTILSGDYLRRPPGSVRGADLSEANLSAADLSGAKLRGADLSGANLSGADLHVADLGWAKLGKANLSAADLSGADLHVADLRAADLSGADLSGRRARYPASDSPIGGTNLSGADLREANLSGTNLRGADLSGTNLSGINLRKVDLSGTNLSGADLREADLGWAKLGKANLSGTNLIAANLSGTNLNGAGLRGADLSGTNLNGADLHVADLSGMNLSGMNLSGLDLGGAELGGADLSGADLRDADLRQARLIDSRLVHTNLTGAKLWETQRGGWSIKGVICQRAFWDRDGKEPTEYGVGDFERIFSEKPRIVLRYPGGISPVDLIMLPLIVERLQAEHPDCALYVRSVQDDGSGATVTITVEDIAKRDSKTFKHEVERLQTQLKYIEGQRDILRDQLMPIFREVVLRGGQTIIGEITNPAMIEGPMSRDIYNIQGQTGQIGPNAQAHGMTFQQICSQSDLDLPRLAQELARLRITMKEKTEGTAEQDEAIGAVAAAEKAAAQGDSPTVLRHLKAAGRWTLGIAEKIGVAVAAEAIKRVV